MYYPFLRARQFELVALRELVAEGNCQDYIVPILEPVKQLHNNLSLAARSFAAGNQKCFLVMNPRVGEVTGDNTHYVHFLVNESLDVFKAGFHYRNNADYIQSCIQNYKLTDCILICQNDVTVDDVSFTALVSLPQISAICIEAPGRNRDLHRFLRGLNKEYIRIDDLFEKQVKNSEFLPIPEHRFSEEHLYYADEGFTGFGDYTIMPSEYTDGGSAPRAVAIHMTYLKENRQIWIRHFTSISNDSIANVQGKFAEAASKAVAFFRERNLMNSAIAELEDYFTAQHYPGLGTVKKISIKNHLLVVADYLRTR